MVSEPMTPATTRSQPAAKSPNQGRMKKRLTMAFAIRGAMLSLVALGAPLEESEKLSFFRQRFDESIRRHQQSPQNVNLTLEYLNAAFEWAELATDKKQRAAIAQPAIEASRSLLRSSPRKGEANYYLALHLGQLARSKWLGALRIVPEMERCLQAAREKSPHLNYAGPDRALSRLYFEAPGWPTSIGNSSKALHHAKAALAIAPRYPGNHLNYLQILVKQDMLNEARNHFDTAERALDQAGQEFNHPEWRFSWEEWNGLWKRLKTQIPR